MKSKEEVKEISKIFELISVNAGNRNCCLYLYFSCTVFLLLLLQNTGSLNLFRMFFWALKQFLIPVWKGAYRFCMVPYPLSVLSQCLMMMKHSLPSGRLTNDIWSPKVFYRQLVPKYSALTTTEMPTGISWLNRQSMRAEHQYFSFRCQWRFLYLS